MDNTKIILADNIKCLLMYHLRKLDVNIHSNTTLYTKYNTKKRFSILSVESNRSLYEIERFSNKILDVLDFDDLLFVNIRNIDHIRFTFIISKGKLEHIMIYNDKEVNLLSINVEELPKEKDCENFEIKFYVEKLLKAFTEINTFK